MLQNGLSRDLFEQWCQDSRNGVIITGYSVEGTLAKVRRFFFLIYYYLIFLNVVF